MIGVAAALAIRSNAARKPGETAHQAAGALRVAALAAAQLHELVLDLAQAIGPAGMAEVVQVAVVLAPGFGRLADDHAAFVALADAAHLLEDDEALEELAAVARGMADDGPADRVLAGTEMLHVGFHLPRVGKLDLAEEGAALPVDARVGDAGMDDALEAVQLRPDAEDVIGIGLAIELVGQLAVLLAADEAHAHQQATGRMLAEPLEQLAPQLPDRFGVKQQHAIFIEPDLAGIDVETQARAQVELLDQLLACHGVSIRLRPGRCAQL